MNHHLLQTAPKSKKSSTQKQQEQLHCFVLSGVSLPQDAVLHILTFVGTYNLTHSTSLVAKSWLAASRSPHLWHTLDLHRHCRIFGLIQQQQQQQQPKNMFHCGDDFLKRLLQRPQFKRLQRLTLPETASGHYRQGTLQTISALNLEQLEELDIGYDNRRSRHSPPYYSKYDPLMLLSDFPKLFPQISRINVVTTAAAAAADRQQHRLDCTRLTDIVAFTRQMKARLKSIRIYDLSYSSVDDSVGLLLHALAEHCPNLERLDYERRYHLAQNNKQDRIQERINLNQGILKLLKECTHLRTLCLINLPRRVNAVLEHFARNDNKDDNNEDDYNCDVNKLERLFVVSQFEVPSILLDKVGRRMESFEYISVGEHERRIQERLPCQSRVYW